MTLPAQTYSARKTTVDGVSVIELSDASRNTTVSIVPSVGNIAYRMDVNGKNAFWFPFDSVKDLAANPKLCGNPFLAPWANRLDEEAFHANGRKYRLNPDLDNFRKDGNHLPIHGCCSMPRPGKWFRSARTAKAPTYPAAWSFPATPIGWRSFHLRTRSR